MLCRNNLAFVQSVLVWRAYAKVISPAIKLIAVAVIDLNRVRRINDELMHEDELLSVASLDMPNCAPCILARNKAPFVLHQPLIVNIIDKCDRVLCEWYLFQCILTRTSGNQRQSRGHDPGTLRRGHRRVEARR